MATVSGGPEMAPASPRRNAPARTQTADTEIVQYEQYIDSQLRKTRLQVKGVELTTALITLAVGSLAYLFLVALIDHWVVKGGLGFAWRLVFLLGFVAGAGTYFVQVLWPLLVRRINPVYAAQAIERSRPSLKNSLINFLLLRSRPDALPAMIYHAMERQAADGLSQVTVESAVDRSRLLKVGWALLAIVALCAVYTIVSPKNPLRSFGRVVAPWADIAAPTRVRIADVTPGDDRAFHDQFVTVSAEVSGIRDGEQVVLFYSTADGQLVDQAVAMTLPPGGLRYTAELPPTSGGLQQNIEYYLAAGDAVTQRYGIKVLVTPSIVVKTVDYQYPRYTEIDARVADRQGDLKGIEGTNVTIHAEANDDIKSAFVDFDCDGRSDVAMQVNGRMAAATFTLALKPKSDAPEHGSYQLRFQNTEGEENPRPIRHQIEVIKDLAPQIAFVEPPEAAEKPARAEPAAADRAAQKDLGNANVAINRGKKNLAGKNLADRLPAAKHGAQETAEPAEQQLPQGGILRMVVEASDPDFKLGSVKLMAQRNGQQLLSNELLPAAVAGPFQRAFQFDSNNLKLASGDAVIYWAVAEDNKQPEPNRTETRHFTLRITSSEQPQRPQDQVAQADPKQQPKPNDRRDQKPNDQKEKGDPQQGDQPKPDDGQKGQGKPNPGGPQDNNPRAQQQREQQRRDQQPEENNPRSDGKQGEDKQNDGKQNDGADQKPDPKNSDEKNPKEKNTERKDSGEQSGGGSGEASKSAGKQGEGKESEGKSAGGKSGEKSSDPASKQDQSSGEDQQRVDENAQPGDTFEKILERRNQEQKENGKEPADQTQGDPSKREQNPDQKPGEKGDEPPGEKNPPDQKPADQKPTDEKHSDQPQGNEAKGNESKGSESKGSESKGSEPKGSEPKGTDAKGNDSKGGQGGEQPDVKKPDMPAAGDKSAGDKTTGNKTPGEEPQKGDAGASPAGEKGEPKGAEKGAEKGTDKDANKGAEQGAPKGAGDPSENGDNKPADPAAADKGAGKQGDPKAGEKSAGDKPAGDKSAGQPMPGDQQAGKPKSGQPKSGDPMSGDPKASDPKAGEPKPSESKSGDPKSTDPKSGQGGKALEQQPDKANSKPQDGTKPEDKKGGDAEAKNSGSSGAGEKGGNKNGSPSPQEDNTPRDKKRDPDGAGKPDAEDKPESPGTSKKQSDSKGGQDGDREGGGGKGGGQPSNSQGTGSAGQNTGADQGSGHSNSPGTGETGEKGGDKAKGKPSDGTGKATGKPGDGAKSQPGGSQPGAGADGKQDPTSNDPAAKQDPTGKPGDQSKPGEKPADGKQPPTGQLPNDGAQKPGDKPQGDPGKANNQSPSPSNSGNKDPGGSAGNPTGGGGLPPDKFTPPEGKAAPNEEGADEANLEYSRKATDLALEYLKDQMKKENPDKKLLEDLKWTREDAARFLTKWEKMKRDAQSAGPQGDAAKKQLDNALEGLGLRPRGTALRGGQTSETRTPTVRDTRRSEPPPEYRQQFRAFTKGVAKGEEGKPAGNK